MSDPSIPRPGRAYRAAKRALDATGAALGLLVLSPLLVPVMVALRFSGEGEVFYRQQRIGRGGQPFGIWKFATMLKDSPNLGTGSLTVRGDPRVTSVGRFLRATKVNELPQLINVLTGEMSFVGPRPQMDVDYDIYTDSVKAAMAALTPGITGIGSVVFRDEQEILSRPGVDPRAFYVDEIAPYKGDLELWYAARASLGVDAKLIAATAVAVLSPRSDVAHRWFRTLPPAPPWLAPEPTA